ncbi:Armadillo-type fold [Artemisia annua]|uniref:Armadillo-type fold n=1 Tax=Artemisia annua TaxID=35608 RepID=A0A2U1KTG4_ARTAN|nr:Armadillo-type fold [Artemisia annua]
MLVVYGFDKSIQKKVLRKRITSITSAKKKVETSQYHLGRRHEDDFVLSKAVADEKTVEVRKSKADILKRDGELPDNVLYLHLYVFVWLTFGYVLYAPGKLFTFLTIMKLKRTTLYDHLDGDPGLENGKHVILFTEILNMVCIYVDNFHRTGKLFTFLTIMKLKRTTLYDHLDGEPGLENGKNVILFTEILNMVCIYVDNFHRTVQLFKY